MTEGARSAHERAPTRAGYGSWLRCQTSCSPSSVSHGSYAVTVSQCGRISPPRPQNQVDTNENSKHPTATWNMPGTAYATPRTIQLARRGQNVPSTRCAWNVNHWPGGSSAGSGVSVAVGSATFTLGSDAGGSIRLPASLNSVVGLKPTYGRVSRRGVVPGGTSTLDCVGPLALTVDDASLVLDAIAGYDRGDPGSVDTPFTATDVTR